MALAVSHQLPSRGHAPPVRSEPRLSEALCVTSLWLVRFTVMMCQGLRGPLITSAEADQALRSTPVCPADHRPTHRPDATESGAVCYAAKAGDTPALPIPPPFPRPVGSDPDRCPSPSGGLDSLGRGQGQGQAILRGR